MHLTAPDHEAAPPADVAGLVHRAQRKDAAAFTLLIGRYERTALSVAYGVLGNADRAADVVQDAFVRAWERLGDLNEPARFAPWLCGIVRNLATDVRRRSRLHPKAETDLAAGGGGEQGNRILVPDHFAPDPLDELARREQRHWIDTALQGLDEQARTVVALRYYQDLSSKEIGQLLGLSPSAVDMRLSRARKELRHKLLALQPTA